MPITHTKVNNAVDDGVSEVQPSHWNAGHTFSLTKSDVGLSNIDNTTDAGKPISSATQAALDGKISHSLATAVNDFLVASGIGVFVKKTLAETIIILRTSLDSIYQAAGSYQPLDADLTTIAGLTATTDNFIQSKSSAWASRTLAQVITDLRLTLDSVYQATLVSATNIKTVNGSTLLGSGDLVVTGTEPDISLSLMAPTVDETITAGYSAYVSDFYEIPSTFMLEIGNLSVMEVG